MSTFEEVELLKAEADAADGEGTEKPSSLAIALDDVTLTHPGRPGPVQTGLSAEIPSRGLTVVAGPSGAGKSTLLAVLLADLPTAGGEVRVGGVPLRDVDRRWWREQIAAVGQRPWILAGTVRENLLLARPGAEDAALWSALAVVGLDDHLRGLPGGLDAEISEDGSSLSAGQRARLALARVVLADRPIVVLDEPTAHLDEETERTIAGALEALARDRCVIVVAHRPEIAARADTLLTLEHSPLLPPEHTSTPTGVPARPATAPLEDQPVPPAHAGGRLALGAALGALAATSGVALMATSGWLITRAAEHPPVLFLFAAIVGVRTFGLARPVFRYAERLVSHDVALRLLAERRAAVYDALVPLVPGALGKQRGDVLASVVDDVDALVDRQLRVRTPLLTWAFTTVIVAVVGWLLDPGSAVVLVTTLVLAGSLGWLISRAGAGRFEPLSIQRRARVSAEVARTLGGADDIVAWQAEEVFLGSVREAGRSGAAATVGSAALTALARAVVLVACGLATVLVADHVVGLVSTNALLGPVAALLVLVPLALYDVLAPATDAGALGVRAHAADDRIGALLAARPAVGEPKAPRPLREQRPALMGQSLAFSWSGTEVFHGLDVDLPPGRRLGVVGPSGSGKSTLVALLLRFVDPSDGRYLIDGVDARELALSDVRRTVTLVDDDPHIFGSTVYENIRLAQPGASEEEVEAVLRTASLDAWVDALPRGMATRIGDGGAAVSGGERARIGLARALLADPAVVVLDEPTAHLDSDTARRVTDTMLGSNPARTLVWVTHGTIGLDRMDDLLSLTAENSTSPSRRGGWGAD
jgi:ATP-binding cassette subfamily C protein CydCD